MIKTYLFIFTSLVLLTMSVSAQMSIELAGKQYNIPSFSNTNDKPSFRQTLQVDSEFMSYHIIEPLSSSPNQFEVRCSSIGSTTNNYQVTILKCNKDSLWWEQYWFHIGQGKRPNANISIELGKSTSSVLPYYFSVIIKRNSIATSSYSVIDTLTHLGLFTQLSMDVILSNLKEKGVKLQQPTIMDCCGDEIFTVKLNNQYRRFIYNGYMPTGNPDVKELAEASKLVNTFYYICSDR